MTAGHDDEVQKIYCEGSAEEPPVAIDRAILKAARESVAPATKPQIPWWLRFALPLQLAFSVVLVAMLALTVDRNPQDAPALTDSAEPRQGQGSPANEAEARLSAPQASNAQARRVERKMEAAPVAPRVPGKVQGDSAEKALAGDIAAPAGVQSSEAASPSDWLAAIERLAAAGEKAAAGVELAAFRKAYPDYTVPERLEKMLTP